MSTVTWGMLLKSLVDPEKIEEAIARIVAEHNEDETAHLGVGQSLQSHKASEIIDHVVESVVDDKLKYGEITLRRLSENEMQLFTAFETLDGWGASTGYFFSKILGSYGQIHEVTTICKKMWAYSMIPGNALRADKDTFFRLAMSFEGPGSYTYYFGAMDYTDDPDDMPVNTGFGFKVVNGALFAVVLDSDGVTPHEVSHALGNIVLEQMYIFAAHLDPLVNTVSFYVNNSLVWQYTNNPVFPLTSPRCFCFTLKGGDVYFHTMYFYNLLFSRQL